MTHITYSELIDRYGTDLAYDMLITVEKSANIRTYDICMDEETRLQRAFAVLETEVLAA